MYTTLFILITIGTLLFYGASEKVKPAHKPAWILRLAQTPRRACMLGTTIFLASWAAVAFLQGPGSGTFAMIGYLMASYCLVVLLQPLEYFNTTRLAVVALAAFFMEIFIF
ncbi:hypothetical protein [Parapedobacter soli]|uniref:hypothetical protein n=1 Tax=Parapedobacter soli TaxID=416955 RepID=UPI0021C89CE6|nr:hypothetical protein [Parapedobacter soli]